MGHQAAGVRDLGTLFKRLGAVQGRIEGEGAATESEIVGRPAQVALIRDEDDDPGAQLADIGSVEDADDGFGG